MYEDVYHSIIFHKNWKLCSAVKDCLAGWGSKWPFKHPVVNVYLMTFETSLYLLR